MTQVEYKKVLDNLEKKIKEELINISPAPQLQPQKQANLNDPKYLNAVQTGLNNSFSKLLSDKNLLRQNKFRVNNILNKLVTLTLNHVNYTAHPEFKKFLDDSFIAFDNVFKTPATPAPINPKRLPANPIQPYNP